MSFGAHLTSYYGIPSKKIQLDPHNIRVLQEPLVGLSGEQV